MAELDQLNTNNCTESDSRVFFLFVQCCQKLMFDFDVQQLHFECGNPSVELVKGTLVFETTEPANASEDSDVIILFANIPLTYSIGRFWNCINPLPVQCAGSSLRLKVLRNVNDEETFSCLAVCGSTTAETFINDYRRTAFGSLDSRKMVIGTVVDMKPVGMHQILLRSLLAPPDAANCAVCLDPLQHKQINADPKKPTVIVQILCGHQFHVECLQQTVGKDCPVCRYPQRPEKPSKCAACRHTTRLRLCLVCGYLGCTRDLQNESRVGSNRPEVLARGHAGEHFVKTGHLFALELDTQRVFDYVCNSYVHRLLQDESGQKLISFEKGMLPIHSSNHFEAELRHLHVTMNEQLLKQNEHFTDVRNAVTGHHSVKIAKLELLKEELSQELTEREESEENSLQKKIDLQITEAQNAKTSLEKEVAELKAKLEDLKSSREAVANRLTERKMQLQDKYKKAQLENSALRRQLADIEVHLQAAKDIASGSSIFLTHSE
eukprot:Gregarina_sp_Poly_1__7480@NODE_416_length_8734_cov_134_157609_g338_i0_p2_GENE_NODE_416_length_8734_cov_134_157609_g338_i0NODE_416_length_8734_cov_134_157609_g338_i0_p2_ORF_typecomplete_len493_score70_75zfUBP/PF02148_19/2_7e16zfRING_2/PF13639_6/3_6e08zfrbx1/PF12678_7/6_4e07WEMBL/PF05701_11/1_1e06zfC3HC4_2/PF13923_6/1e05zfRING_5/PF14634_6/1_2e05zfRING_5/PF14634_6/1_8e03AIP3/PF03915_13/1_4e05CCCAP/PF15964_5/2_7e05zfC3HC4/PF00097_25/5_4e05zfC3HC4/PF00097_25/1_5e03zfANAPC11/PF12861_7/0_00036zfRING_11